MCCHNDVKSQRLNDSYVLTTSVVIRSFIYPTGWIRVCKIRSFVSTGENDPNRGKPCMVCKKDRFSATLLTLKNTYRSFLEGFLEKNKGLMSLLSSATFFPAA